MKEIRLFTPRVWAALGTVALAALAGASDSRILIIAAEPDGVLGAHVQDVRSKLMGAGTFGVIDVYDGRLGSPTWNQLIEYDAVLTWSRVPYLSAVNMGNTLASFASQGGGVVTGLFANVAGAGTRLEGNSWLQPTYQVFDTTMQPIQNVPSQLGTVNPCTWLSQNFTQFQGGSASYRPNGQNLVAGCFTVATWADNTVMAAQGSNGRRIDLGIYPPSSTVNPAYWNAQTDGAVLMANALMGVASRRREPHLAFLSAGYHAGGNLQSLQRSDDDRYYILGDEWADEPVLRANFNVGTQPVRTLRSNVELRISRNDVLAFIELKRQNTTTEVWDSLMACTPAPTEVLRTSWTTNGAQYVRWDGEIEMRIRFVAFSDLRSLDGWMQWLDLVQIVAGNP